MKKIKLFLLAILLMLGLTACEPPPESGVVTMSYVTTQTSLVGKVYVVQQYSNVYLDNGYFMYQPTMTLFIQCQIGETWTRENDCP